MHSFLKDQEKQGTRFSYTTDEWTSTANKRYCNINVHLPGGYSMRLGMVRIKDTFTSERAAEIFEQQLDDYGLQLENQFGVTTDGASVMCKMGRILKIYHQLCMAHGIHLAGT